MREQPADPPADQSAAVQPGATSRCVRCGAAVLPHVSMCERCNPLDLAAPAASQAHGTVVLGIVGAVVVMAVAARLLMSGVGPFQATVDDVVAVAGGLSVTITLANEGTAGGATTCRIDDPSRGGVSPSAVFVESPRVPAGGSITFDVAVGGLGTVPRPLMADC